MPDRTCANCGQPMPPDSRFCAQCGAVVAGAASGAPTSASPASSGPVMPGETGHTLIDPRRPDAMEKASQATMFGFSASAELLAKPLSAKAAPAPIVPAPIVAASTPPAASPAPAAPVAPPPSAPAPVSAGPSHKQTMIGVASPMLAPPRGAATPAPAPVASAPAAVPSAKGTMLGVAIPGIAPLSASAPPPRAPGGASGTMLGVAIPGIAPVRATAPADARPASKPPPAIVPKPPPLVDDEPAVGPAPRIAKKGIPLAYVAGGVLVLVVVFGALVALLWHGQSLVVVPKLDAQGHEQLHLQCDSCKDGTTAALDSAKATFKDKEADLVLANPLKVGDNPLSIRLDRPGWGRDEEVQVVVPVAFRIKADLSSLSGAHPTVIVRVEATPGTAVQVDGKPVPLDAQGAGAYSVDVSAQASGWSDELKLIEQSIPYSIAPPAKDGPSGAPQSGKLAVRAGIATLHLDAPGTAAVIESASFRVAGHTVKGGTVTLNGQPVPVDPDGSFARAYDAPDVGDVPLELRADGPQLATRTAHFIVKRVAHLAAEARGRERAPWLAYDALVAGGKDDMGKATIVEGDVADARVTSNHVVAVIDDARGCDPATSGGPCVVRVVYGGTEPIAQGDHVRVYGHYRGMLAAGAATGGKAVPAVEADFVLKGRGGGR